MEHKAIGFKFHGIQKRKKSIAMRCLLAAAAVERAESI
jgi:hypothetical protein